MSLKDVQIKNEYQSFLDDMPKDFYVPLLSQAVSYKRAVGFFSSTILVKISQGINQLVKNGGKIKLIATPYLSEEDIIAIRDGYARRDNVIENALLRGLKQPANKQDSDRLNLLANLVADGILDIKIATLDDDSSVGMFHDKMGIIEDSEGNIVAFSGSMNETGVAVNASYESIDVFTSWSNDNKRVELKVNRFESIWDNRIKKLSVLDFEGLTDELVKKYKTSNVNYNKLVNEDMNENVKPEPSFFKMPDSVSLYKYQKEAIDTWIGKNYCGIFDMATGAGKTYTALGAITKLSQILDEKIAVIIVAPYQHLVEQWVEDIKLFNVQPLVAYSYPGQNWQKEFKNAVKAYNIGVKDHFCVIATNATFALSSFQAILSEFKKNFLFVADEVHNLGAGKISKLLPRTAKYRLGLSATVERYGDEEGTAAIKKYFGSKCITFSLKDAIDNGFLTTYYYYPVVCFLNEDERERYEKITAQIGKFNWDKEEDRNVLELLFIKRARIVAGCKDKVSKLVDEMKQYKDDNHILVYCGATNYDKSDSDDSDERQIEEVNRRLYSELGMKVCKFTSSEDKDERKNIRDRFVVGEDLQVLTAIKCLDEGVNIPAIKIAFILASSTNPKEYIQRRGRILRRAEGKDYAIIYDFITLPRELELVKYCDSNQKKMDRSLVDKEFKRMSEFAETAQNPYEIDDLKYQILNAYKVKEKGDIYE